MQTTLCEGCKKMNLWREDFQIHEDLKELEDSSKSCAFCDIRWKSYRAVDQNLGPSTTVHFHKMQSHLRLNEGYPPVLTIHYLPGKCLLPYKTAYFR